MPLPFARTDDPMLPFAQALIDATRDLVCAYVLDPAYFLNEGAPGLIALERIAYYVPNDIPIVLDARYGLLGDSAPLYARAAFDAFRAEAVTFSVPPDPQTLSAFLKYSDKMLFLPESNGDLAQAGLIIDAQRPVNTPTDDRPRLIRHAAYRAHGHSIVTARSIVESNSALIYASRRDDFADVVREATRMLRDKIG
jgi:orotidine-5'-phosphate decarboxylase